MKNSLIIEVEKADFDYLSSILDREDAVEDVKSIHTFKTFTANFGNGIEADIKVCNGNSPYVDAVLFDNGSEVSVLDVSEELEGEYEFHYNCNIYSVVLKCA